MTLLKKVSILNSLKSSGLVKNKRNSIFLASIAALFIAIVPVSSFAHLSSLAQLEKSEKKVAEATNTWLNTVTSGSEGVVDETLSLYSEDGILWGTVSEQVRDTPAEIRDYFEYFANLPELSVSSYKGCIRMYDENFAINSGYYTFTFSKDGETKEVPARYSFAYQKGNSNQWDIIEHHSSALPEAPEALEIVSAAQDTCENGLLVER